MFSVLLKCFSTRESFVPNCNKVTACRLHCWSCHFLSLEVIRCKHGESLLARKGLKILGDSLAEFLF